MDSKELNELAKKLAPLVAEEILKCSCERTIEEIFEYKKKREIPEYYPECMKHLQTKMHEALAKAISEPTDKEMEILNAEENILRIANVLKHEGADMKQDEKLMVMWKLGNNLWRELEEYRVPR